MRADADVDAQTTRDREYINFTGFPFPLTPLFSRTTVMEVLVPGKVWSLEQEQGIGLGLGVSTNVRMTVVKMRDKRLWVHSPIAPTRECLDMVSSLGGDVAGPYTSPLLISTGAISLLGVSSPNPHPTHSNSTHRTCLR